MRHYTTVGERKTYSDLTGLWGTGVELVGLKFNQITRENEKYTIKSDYWNRANSKRDFSLTDGKNYLHVQFDDNGQLVGMVNHGKNWVFSLLNVCGDWEPNHWNGGSEVDWFRHLRNQ